MDLNNRFNKFQTQLDRKKIGVHSDGIGGYRIGLIDKYNKNDIMRDYNEDDAYFAAVQTYGKDKALDLNSKPRCLPDEYRNSRDKCVPAPVRDSGFFQSNKPTNITISNGDGSFGKLIRVPKGDLGRMKNKVYNSTQDPMQTAIENTGNEDTANGFWHVGLQKMVAFNNAQRYSNRRQDAFKKGYIPSPNYIILAEGSSPQSVHKGKWYALDDDSGMAFDGFKRAQLKDGTYVASPIRYSNGLSSIPAPLPMNLNTTSIFGYKDDIRQTNLNQPPPNNDYVEYVSNTGYNGWMGSPYVMQRKDAEGFKSLRRQLVSNK